MKRYALVTLTWDRDNPVAYMPSNYEVLWIGPFEGALASDRLSHVNRPDWRLAVIGGEDNAGWTLDDYVLPRLASGGMYGEEIDLSHDVMKRVPDSKPQCPMCRSADVRKATVYWQCLTCGNAWQSSCEHCGVGLGEPHRVQCPIVFEEAERRESA